MKYKFTMSFEVESEDVQEAAFEAVIAFNQMSLTQLQRVIGHSMSVYDSEGAQIGTWKVEEVPEDNRFPHVIAAEKSNGFINAVGPKKRKRK